MSDSGRFPVGIHKDGGRMPQPRPKYSSTFTHASSSLHSSCRRSYAIRVCSFSSPHLLAPNLGAFRAPCSSLRDRSERHRAPNSPSLCSLFSASSSLSWPRVHCRRSHCLVQMCTFLLSPCGYIHDVKINALWPLFSRYVFLS